MSATEAHVFEQKLIAGETYTLAEVTAPSGYEVAADITFTVNKDGTVSIDGKAVDGNEIIMKDDTTPVGEEGKLVVSKLVFNDSICCFLCWSNMAFCSITLNLASFGRF